jgi:hypothetical protein
MQMRLKVLVPVAFGIATLLPSAAFAQQAPQAPPVVVQPPHEAAFCGNQDVPMVGQGQLLVPQPDAMSRPDEGVLDFSAVRGSIVHMEGNMILLKLDHMGNGNAAPNHELAGDNWAVVQMPSGCSPSDFGMGTAILAVGTPNGHGVLEAVEITETA